MRLIQCLIAVGLIDCVPILLFRHLIFLGIALVILMAAGLLKKGVGMCQTMEVRVPNTVGCTSSRSYSMSCFLSRPYYASYVPIGPN